MNGTAFFYIVGAVALIFIYLKTDKKGTMSEKVVVPFRHIILISIAGVFISLLSQSLLNILEMVLTGQSLDSQNTKNIIRIVQQAPFFVFAVSIAGPIMEELVFRFSLTNFIGQKLPEIFAAVITSLLFAVMHGDGHWLVYGGLGFIFFLVYRKTHSIWSSILTHAGMNTVVVVMQLVLIKS